MQKNVDRERKEREEKALPKQTIPNIAPLVEVYGLEV